MDATIEKMKISKQASIDRIIKPKHGLVPIDFKELWRYSELLGFFAWRDILIRYKQTAIGIAWAIIQPFLTMIVFTVIFGGLAKFPSNGMPYAVMTFSAVLPWQFFANALTQGSASVLGASSIITKVYFPRLIIPASSTLSGVVDFAVSLLMLFGLMVWYNTQFRLHLLLLPLFFLLGFATAFGANLWFSALNVKYRDVKYVVPFIVRMGMYISPVGFMSSIVPEKYRLVYSLNPMVGVIDGFRWCILGPKFEPNWLGFWVSVIIVAIILISGAYYFRAMEKTFADII